MWTAAEGGAASQAGNTYMGTMKKVEARENVEEDFIQLNFDIEKAFWISYLQARTPMATILTPQGAVLPPMADKICGENEGNVNTVNRWLISDIFGFSFLEVFIYTFCIPLL